MKDRFLVPAKYFEPDGKFKQHIIAAGCAMVSDFKTDYFRPLMSSSDSYSMDPLSNDWWIHFRTNSDETSIPEGFVQVSIHHRYKFVEGVDAVVTLLIHRYGLERHNGQKI